MTFDSKRTPSKMTKALFTLFILTILWAVVYLCIMIRTQTEAFFPDMANNKRLILNELSHSARTEKGTGCQMPQVNPFSEEALKFNRHKMHKIDCNRVDWVECYRDECFVVKNSKTASMKIQCSYRDIIYINDESYDFGKPVSLKQDEKYKLNRSDSVKVSCVGRSLTGIDIVPVRWYGYKSGFRTFPATPRLWNEPQSIMIIVFDSASKAGFTRSMPKSYKMLKAMRFVIMNSYNIVGDGTTAALLPLLTGKSEYELLDNMKHGKEKRRYLDKRDFIFDIAKGLGYRTAYFEDTFQYRINGFLEHPADHHLRSLWMAESKHGKKWHEGQAGRYCIGGTPLHSFLLNLTDQFLHLPTRKFGLTFISSICHDDFNMISAADEEFADFLKRIYKHSNILKNTALIVMGDHGNRVSRFRQTYQGKLEERLPLMAIRLSDEFARANPKAESALRSNADVLTTSFDINAMLLDLLEQPEVKNSFVVEGSDLLRSLSLINSIPPSRSCGEAGIQPQWCACSKWQTINATDAKYYAVVDAIVRFVNNITNEQRSLCQLRSLGVIHQVQRFSPDINMLLYKKSRDMDGLFGDFSDDDTSLPELVHYQATVSMSPGGAMFEGTVILHRDTDTMTITEKDISRIDAYGDQSKCISKEYPRLSKFCYCNTYNPRNETANVLK